MDDFTYKINKKEIKVRKSRLRENIENQVRIYVHAKNKSKLVREGERERARERKKYKKESK